MNDDYYFIECLETSFMETGHIKVKQVLFCSSMSQCMYSAIRLDKTWENFNRLKNKPPPLL